MDPPESNKPSVNTYYHPSYRSERLYGDGMVVRIGHCLDLNYALL